MNQAKHEAVSMEIIRFVFFSFWFIPLCTAALALGFPVLLMAVLSLYVLVWRCGRVYCIWKQYV